MEKVLATAVKNGVLPKAPVTDLIDLALEHALIDEHDAELLRAAEALRREVISVDDFPKEYLSRTVKRKTPRKTKS